MDEKILFRAEKINKSFGPTHAVADFSIEISPGEVRGLIGENGSGKSTFSAIIAGLHKPDSGRLFFQGKEYMPSDTSMAAQAGASLIVQEIGTIAGISVAANIFINKERKFAKHGMLNYEEMNREARKILDKIGGEHIDPSVITGKLNLEDRKLVEIAKAMYSQPALLIIDETSNALTTHGRNILYQNIDAVRQEGGSVIFITHDLDELMSVCDSVTIMRDGHYITTLRGAEMEQKKMKELMVGREISNNFYRSDMEPNYRRDRVVLEATDLCSIEVGNVSFKLHEGEILGIGGLAESGMHELGRLLFGLEKKDSGEVVVAKSGDRIHNPQDAIRNSVGYMSKNRDTEALLLRFSISDNIALPSLDRIKEKGMIFKKNEHKLAGQWAENLSIKMRGLDDLCTKLSGGNKQKVVLGKWLGNDSHILIMDCPTRGIDIGVKEAIYRLMENLKAEGKAIVMISEELPELIGMSDTILIMKDGMITRTIERGEDVTEQTVIQYMI
ncbi:sugar ABC transporter ATP-binding protein [Anaerofilum sp. BX8]|uniref:Sugar ABC transporter ATP-binding protein n=1 Tax=Anaerofilum hominis TaxID=2763016 RepID=A0A923ICK6_9FIRM|nr:sugar ABC transporter ATP-binding protein [Anaerofilum hominis]MBC5580470.1 sugar ABC transporter ATP-binding protein [Anaerofilum hominis]